jgi:hypothetical protein
MAGNQREDLVGKGVERGHGESCACDQRWLRCDSIVLLSHFHGLAMVVNDQLI